MNDYDEDMVGRNAFWFVSDIHGLAHVVCVSVAMSIHYNCLFLPPYG